MKRVFKSAAAIALALCMVLGCVSCGGKKPFVYEYEKESENMIRFSSSDASFDAFINDFFHRHLSYDEDRIYPIDLGESAWFAKEWESMALKFFDVGAGNLGTDGPRGQSGHRQVRLCLERLARARGESRGQPERNAVYAGLALPASGAQF